MPPDRLLSTVLRAFQSPPNPEQTSQILSTTTSLLTTLSNPLNITLLTSHFLVAPAIWDRSNDLFTSFRIISAFNTAAITVRKYELEGQPKPYDAYQPRRGGGIRCDDWVKAVVKGLDDRSARWQHSLVLTGLLLGMEGQARHSLSNPLKITLENAITTATNLALSTPGVLHEESVVLALTHSFPLLSQNVRRELDYDALVPIMIRAMTSTEGYEDSVFLQAIDLDVIQVPGNQFNWSGKSSSFLNLQRLASRPLVTAMGPLSRLIAHSLENCRSPLRILEAQEQLFLFSNGLCQRWRRNKLSEIDQSEEQVFLSPETLRVAVPALWQVLKTAMFAIVVILRAMVGRTLIDPVLSSSHNAPVTASKTLHILRNIHFVSSRLGSNSFSAYAFVNLASIDILNRFPDASVSFLHTIYPSHAGKIPVNPLERNLDLFYLNTVEHFTLVLSPPSCESLVVDACTPYLHPSGNPYLSEIFESAHSAMLSLFSAPQNTELTARIIPFYTGSLFASFPASLSPRQFRFAFKTLIQISTAPNPLAISQPMMAETLLEILHHRALKASTVPLPPSILMKSEGDAQAQEIALSEQAALLLTLLDALPNITISILEDWLSLAAQLLNAVPDRNMKEHCRKRFWEVLESGEMDVERSAICVGWWATRGGKEVVLLGYKDGGPYMSGGLAARNGSRL